jgi:hypothetical protein
VGEGDFIPVRHRQRPATSVKAPPEHEDTAMSPEDDNTTTSEDDDDPSVPVASDKPLLFSCPEDGCVKSYLTHGRLDQHLMYGKHELRLEKLTLMDKAKTSYAQRLEAGAQTSIGMTIKMQKKQMKRNSHRCSKGWALRDSEKKYKRFNTKQKKFLEEKFVNGEKTGIKSTGEDVSKSMRYTSEMMMASVFSQLKSFSVPSR